MKKTLFLTCCLILLACNLALAQFANPAKGLKVSADGHSLEYADGKPFFWLGDTGWEIFHRLDKKEVDYYLETRAKQGFNVIQVVVVPELRGLTEPNRFGDLPLIDLDLNKPNEKYFEFVDYVVNKAASLGLFLAMLPTWGDAWDYQPWGDKNLLLNPENAMNYGNFIGKRYKNNWNVVWVMGGDRNPGTEEHYTIIRNLVKGIKKGDNGSHLFTYHPGGDCSSASFFHEEKWLDFNMTQTGHSNRKVPTYMYALTNYCMFPVKPCLDGEPRYEDIPVRFWEIKLDEKYKDNPSEFPDSLTPYGYFNDYDMRTAAYWSVFSGACGHTYGNGSIWCFWEKGRYSPIAVKYPWQKGVLSPGCIQMGYLRKLIEQFGLNNLRPDRNVITNNSFVGENYIGALRAKDGSVVLIYTPVGESFKVSLTKLTGKEINARWFNPGTGIYSNTARIDTKSLIAEFTPPAKGNDWILVLESK